MIRNSLFFTEQQMKKLKKEAAALGLKTAELVRRIIDQYFEKKDGIKK